MKSGDTTLEHNDSRQRCPLFSPLIIALGDSLIAGFALAAAECFPAQLEKRLRQTLPSARVLNAGVSGDTTNDVLRRLPAVMSSLNARPDLAIVQVGPNDVLRYVTPVRTRAHLEQILIELGRYGIPVLLTTVDPPPFLRARAGVYLDIHTTLAAQYGAATCPFFPPGVLGGQGMVLADGVHPNAAAIARVAEAMLPAVEVAMAGGKPALALHG